MQDQEFDHLFAFTTAERRILLCGFLRELFQLMEIRMARRGIVRQQDARSKGDEGTVDHVKIKLVLMRAAGPRAIGAGGAAALARSEEHTSELQSHSFI